MAESEDVVRRSPAERSVGEPELEMVKYLHTHVERRRAMKELGGVEARSQRTTITIDACMLERLLEIVYMPVESTERELRLKDSQSEPTLIIMLQYAELIRINYYFRCSDRGTRQRAKENDGE
jgi:hypothetical protein